MPEKITALIFSKDDDRQAMDLVKSIHGAVDEIVLMDASSREEKRYVEEEKRRNKLTKLRIFDVIALGYREPLTQYALLKCRNRWILLLDTDFELTEELKASMHELVSKPVGGCSAYAVKINSVHPDGHETLVSWQIRLFDKYKTVHRGMVHEQPLVDGRISKLADPDAYLKQILPLVHSTHEGYAKMERFERFTYSAYNDRVIDQLSKVIMPSERSIKDSGLGRFVHMALRLYETVTFRKGDEEIGNVDYFMLRVMRDIAHQARRHNLAGVLHAVPAAFEYIGRMKEWRSGKDAQDEFEIAQILEREGVINFLQLDKKGVVERLNRKYKNRKQGIDLLLKLIKERYAGGAL